MDFPFYGLETSMPAASAAEALAFRQYYRAVGGHCSESYVPKVQKWARVMLPNDQVVKSAWQEKKKPLSKVKIGRRALVRAIKLQASSLCNDSSDNHFQVELDGQLSIADIRYYFLLTVNESCRHGITF